MGTEPQARAGERMIEVYQLILSSSTASTFYAEPSKPNKPAPIAPAHSPRALQPTADHAAAEPRVFTPAIPTSPDL
jgi:hypothetical protein